MNNLIMWEMNLKICGFENLKMQCPALYYHNLRLQVEEDYGTES